jgi:hypothetical protein
MAPKDGENVHDVHQVQEDARLFANLCSVVEEILIPILQGHLTARLTGGLKDELACLVEALASDQGLSAEDEEHLREEAEVASRAAPPSDMQIRRMARIGARLIMSSWLEVVRQHGPIVEVTDGLRPKAIQDQEYARILERAAKSLPIGKREVLRVLVELDRRVFSGREKVRLPLGLTATRPTKAAATVEAIQNSKTTTSQ